MRGNTWVRLNHASSDNEYRKARSDIFEGMTKQFNTAVRFDKVKIVLLGASQNGGNDGACSFQGQKTADDRGGCQPCAGSPPPHTT